MQALKPGGLIVIKDNTIRSGSSAYWVDSDDGYFVRCEEYQEKVYELANMRIVSKAPQVKWPEDAYPVTMYALEPRRE